MSILQQYIQTVGILLLEITHGTKFLINFQNWFKLLTTTLVFPHKNTIEAHELVWPQLRTRNVFSLLVKLLKQPPTFDNFFPMGFSGPLLHVNMHLFLKKI